MMFRLVFNWKFIQLNRTLFQMLLVSFSCIQSDIQQADWHGDEIAHQIWNYFPMTLLYALIV